jgi:hypothetical protein
LFCESSNLQFALKRDIRASARPYRAIGRGHSRRLVFPALTLTAFFNQVERFFPPAPSCWFHPVTLAGIHLLWYETDFRGNMNQTAIDHFYL